MASRYGKNASEKIKGAMQKRRAGTLKSGRSGKKVTSRKQAIAIGLSQARWAGGKVPPPKNTSIELIAHLPQYGERGAPQHVA